MLMELSRLRVGICGASRQWIYGDVELVNSGKWDGIEGERGVKYHRGESTCAISRSVSETSFS